VLATLIASSALAAGELSGPAFAPATLPLDPGKGWEQKAFQHETDDADADLVVIINQQFDDSLRPVIADFARQNNLQINVHKGTCGLSAGALLAKTAEITSFCCPPGAIDRLPGLSFHTLAIYPISILVHPDNPTVDLPWATVQQIFAGKIQRWSELNWNNLPIQPVIRLHCKKRPGHWRLLLDHQDLFSAYAREVGAIDDMYGLVSELPGAIGYEVDEGVYSRKTKSVRIDGMDPRNLEHLRRGDYPFYRVMTLTLWTGEGESFSRSRQLLELLTRYVEANADRLGVVPASQLRAAGWDFSGGELIGQPTKP
jgi:hypothetical protein